MVKNRIIFRFMKYNPVNSQAYHQLIINKKKNATSFENKTVFRKRK